MIPEWRDYQEQAASFFSSLGYVTTVDATVTGARGTHDVDVLVQFEQFGMQHVWVVECKAWKRRVTKREVLTLRSVVEDIGADRGFLLSEHGFQSGAAAAAHASNVALTDLGKLSSAAHEEVLELKRRQLEQRVIAVDGRMLNLAPLDVGEDGGYERRETARVLLETLDAARFGRLNAAYRARKPGARHPGRETDLETLLSNVDEVVTELETWRDSLGESSSDLVDRLVTDTGWLERVEAELSRSIVGSTLDNESGWEAAGGSIGERPIIEAVLSLGDLDLIGMYTLYGTPMPYFSSDCELSVSVNGTRHNVVAEARFELCLVFPTGELSEFRFGGIRPTAADG